VSFPAYQSYKESGVEWLGQVPSHWDTIQLRHLVDCCDGARVPLNAEQRADRKGLIPYWGANSIVDYVDAALFDEELVLLGEDGAPFLDRTKPVAFRSVGPIWPNNHVHVLRPLHSGSARYLAYALNSTDYVPFIDGSTRDKLTQSSMVGIPVAWPSKSERDAIAAFLDRETAKIDALVEAQERLIALLKEKRQAVISHAVTKGLAPSAPMKASGVEWLGQVPAHWEVTRLKRVVSSITVGIVVEPSKYYVDEGVPALRSLNVRPGRIRPDDLVFISDEANELHSKSKLNAGDIVAVRTGQPGTAAVVPSEFHGANCVDLIIIRKGHELCEQFLCWFLASDGALQQFAEGSGGAIQLHFNVSAANELVLAVPPLAEQQRIATELDRNVRMLDALVSESEAAITLLQERRAALISAAVTGKIDVRANAAPMQEANAA